MPFEDIKEFKVRLYSPDGVNSPILEYLFELSKKNKEAYFKCLDELLGLPLSIVNNDKSIKPFKGQKVKFSELKVKQKNNEFRFFFAIEKPNVIVIYGFTKKTQKTEKNDIKNGVNNFEDYQINHLTIPFDIM
jgi:phage-related protein